MSDEVFEWITQVPVAAQRFKFDTNTEPVAYSMLILKSNGEQRLITFLRPNKTHPVRELLKEVGIQVNTMDKVSTISYLNRPDRPHQIDFVCMVGFTLEPRALQQLSMNAIKQTQMDGYAQENLKNLIENVTIKSEPEDVTFEEGGGRRRSTRLKNAKILSQVTADINGNKTTGAAFKKAKPMGKKIKKEEENALDVRPKSPVTIMAADSSVITKQEVLHGQISDMSLTTPRKMSCATTITTQLLNTTLDDLRDSMEQPPPLQRKRRLGPVKGMPEEKKALVMSWLEVCPDQMATKVKLSTASGEIIEIESLSSDDEEDFEETTTKYFEKMNEHLEAQTLVDVFFEFDEPHDEEKTKTYGAHLCVLALASPLFKRMNCETNQHVLISEIKPDVFKKVLK